jgi:hypothetical protein
VVIFIIPLWPCRDIFTFDQDFLADSGRSYGLQLVSGPTDAVGPEHCNMQVTTLVLGRLCVHLVYAPDLPLDQFEYEGLHLTCIWPPSRFLIDTSAMTGLSDRDVLWLHETFARSAPSLQPLPAQNSNIES